MADNMETTAVPQKLKRHLHFLKQELAYEECDGAEVKSRHEVQYINDLKGDIQNIQSSIKALEAPNG